jgi:predicted Zn finger-like uncharacterized protein
MQTCCPNCETKFRLTETQLELADGMVRCGICQHVFNVYEVSSEPGTDRPSLPVDHDPAADTEAFSSTNHDESDDAHKEYTDSIVIDAEALPTEQTDGDHFNFFDDNDEHSSGHVVPEELRDAYGDETHSTFSTILWSIGILFLTATLFIEYAWFNRNQLSRIPEVQSRIEDICKQTDCRRLTLRAPMKIELVTRNIYSHPNEKDVLLIDVTMKNNASFSQPYPVMKIDFSDIRGGIVASRNFLPREYLAAGNKPDDSRPDFLAPNSSSSITMEILDPGIQAMTYEFDFL